MLEDGMPVNIVAAELGYTPRHVYNIKKEHIERLEAEENREHENEHDIKLQVKPANLQAHIDEHISAILSSISIIHEEALSAESAHEFEILNNKAKVLGELISNLNQLCGVGRHEGNYANSGGTGIRSAVNGGQNVTGAVGDPHNFVEILKKTSESAKKDN